MLSHTPPPRPKDDDGSMILAVSIIMVVSLLLVVVLSLVTSGLTSSRNDQNRTNAFQFANAGIDQALYRIDRNVMPAIASGSYAPIFNGATQVGFTDAVAVGTSSLTIDARQSPAGQTTTWKVRATGVDPSGRKRQAITTLTANPIFINGFFTLDDFYLTGNQSFPQAYRSSVCPTASCEVNPVPGTIGTNATFSGSGVDHFADLWQGFNMYGRATQAAAQTACSGCPAAKVRAITDALVVSVLPQPSSASCPAAGNGTISGTVEPGNYVCNSAVVLGNITVGVAGNGTGIVRLWVNNKVDLAGNVNVNQVPSKFQLFVPQPSGGGSYTGADFCDGTIFALIDAPGLPISCTGSHQPEIYGAVIANIHGGTGNHFGFHWDLDAAGVLNDGKYVVKNWRECPPAASDC